MKTKMTAEQAREYLKDKYVPVKNRTEALIASKMLKELGLRDLHENQRYKGGNLSIGQDSTFVRFTGEYVWSAKNRETELPLSDLLSIEVVEEPDYRDSELFKSDLKYHAIQFADFILKNAETQMDASGMFTFKRPNGEERSSSGLYSDWLYEYGPQETLSQILEETRKKQNEILRQRDNTGDPLENLKSMDI